MEDFSPSKKTLHSHDSLRRILRRITSDVSAEQQPDQEHIPMLSDASPSSDEVIVRIDGGDLSNPNLKNVGGGGGEDATTRLIGQFLKKQEAYGGEKLLDMDLEMEELRNGNFSRGANEMKVSFRSPSFCPPGPGKIIDIAPDDHRNNNQPSRSSSSTSSSSDEKEKSMPPTRRQSLNSNAPPPHQDFTDNSTVLKCTSFQRRASGIGRLKTRSRLLDPPETTDRKSGMMKSGQLRSQLQNNRASGLLEKTEEEDDDTLFDDDLPDNYNKAKFDALTIAECISLLMLVIALICTLVISSVKVIRFRGLSLWKWEVLVLVLICGRLVSGWGIRIAVFFIERNFFMRKRILYFVYGVRKAVRNCIWLGLVLVAWRSMFDKNVDANNEFLRLLNKMMLCMLVGTLLWLVKTLMVKVLASSFHVSTFFDRIQESVFNQYVIETLSGPPLIEAASSLEEEEKTMAEVRRLQKAGATLPPELLTTSQALNNGSKYRKVSGSGGLPPKPTKAPSSTQPEDHQGGGIDIEALHKMNHKNVSAWSMKRLIKIVKHGSLATVDEQALVSSESDEASTTISSEFEAKNAARHIFRNVAKPRAKFIYLEDLIRFLREEEAMRTLNIVEGSPESNKISKTSLKNWVVNAFRERKALALTLNDTKTAVKKLHQMVDVIVAIVILIIWLVILGIATSKFLLFISSELVVATFIFGNSCRTVFEAVIFVFVIHPFDVGDRCEVDGVQMVVEEMNILTTVFLKGDNQKIIFPNVTLATRPISNFYRSPDMGDAVEFAVHVATPAEKISVIKQRITSYVENKSDHWYNSPSVVVMDLIGLNAVKLSVWLRHKMNFQDIGEKWKRRALLIEEMIKIFKELDIDYRLYPLDVNVREIVSARVPPQWTSPSAASRHL